jgi:hypothetical protein
MFATSPEAWELPAGATGKLVWAKFMDDWPNVPPGACAAVEFPGGNVVYIPVMYLLGPLGESLLWV